MNVHNPMFPIIGLPVFTAIDNDFVCDAKFDSHSETTNYLEGTMFYFVPLSDYNKMMGTNETLASDEALLFSTRYSDYNESTISFEHGMTYTIKKQIDKFRPDGNSMAIFPLHLS